jgi:hypothetical protein
VKNFEPFADAGFMSIKGILFAAIGLMLSMGIFGSWIAHDMKEIKQKNPPSEESSLPAQDSEPMLEPNTYPQDGSDPNAYPSDSYQSDSYQESSPDYSQPMSPAGG